MIQHLTQRHHQNNKNTHKHKQTNKQHTSTQQQNTQQQRHANNTNTRPDARRTHNTNKLNYHTTTQHK